MPNYTHCTPNSFTDNHSFCALYFILYSYPDRNAHFTAANTNVDPHAAAARRPTRLS